MKPFDSQSYQAHQDVFVDDRLGDTGTFLDIGACEPKDLSNTWALEQVGWTGTLIEMGAEQCARLRAGRAARVVQADATKLDWTELFPSRITGMAALSLIDYLSLDIDEGTLPCLQGMPLNRLRFKIITIEHDAYRLGNGPRDAMREILTRAGYHLERADVCSDQGGPGNPFEDWWVLPGSF